MGNKIFVSLVVLLWLITMSWLVVAKILPPLDQGEPPSHQALRAGEPVCWRLYWNDQTAGWAASQIRDGAAGTKEIHGRVQLSEINLADLAPAWMASIITNVGPIDMDARSEVHFDPLGKLSSFVTTIDLGSMRSAVRMSGRVKDTNLEVRIKSGEFLYETQRFLPQSATLAGEFAPKHRMPAMYVGRRWKTQVFSPFRPPNEPAELVEAEVVAQQPIQFDGKSVRARRIEYRQLGNPGVDEDERVRGTIWVAEDGTVLRQQFSFLDALLRFDRVLGEESTKLAEELLD